MAAASSARGRTSGERLHGFLARIPTAVLWIVVLVWTIPSFGLLVNSFREPAEQRASGWWNVFTDPTFTLDAYDRALTDAPGGALPMWDYFLNSLSIAIPATIIPIGIAALAAYAFAWMEFPGRNWLFIITVALLAIPIQAALVPLLSLFGATSPGAPSCATTCRSGSPTPPSGCRWRSSCCTTTSPACHATCSKPSASTAPTTCASSARWCCHCRSRRWRPSRSSSSSGCGTTTWWRWCSSAGQRGQLADDGAAREPRDLQGPGLELLPAAAFISMLVPLLIFFALQRFFVRGLLAGSVKG